MSERRNTGSSIQASSISGHSTSKSASSRPTRSSITSKSGASRDRQEDVTKTDKPDRPDRPDSKRSRNIIISKQRRKSLGAEMAIKQRAGSLARERKLGTAADPGQRLRLPGVPHLVKVPDVKIDKNKYRNHQLLSYRREKEKQKEIQELIKKQAARNRDKSLHKNKSSQPGKSPEKCAEEMPKFPQEHYIALLRYPACVNKLLKEASEEYETSLRTGFRRKKHGGQDEADKIDGIL